MCQTWAELYNTVAPSREEVLYDNTFLKKEVEKLSDNEETRVKKLASELDVCRQKLCEVQDSLS